VGAVTDAGIIDQNTQPAMGRNCEVDHRGDFALVRDIDLERLTADFVRGPLGPFAIPIGDDHQRALRGQAFARLQTLAGCAAGDDSDLFLEPHIFLPLENVSRGWPGQDFLVGSLQRSRKL
jgi:hypothetical protein